MEGRWALEHPVVLVKDKISRPTARNIRQQAQSAEGAPDGGCDVDIEPAEVG
jgi:hypothetical protein